MIESKFECDDVDDPDHLHIEGSTDGGCFDIFPLRRDDACKLLVTIRGWLFATKDAAIAAGIYRDDEILN